jgi:hypothetical protein
MRSSFISGELKEISFQPIENLGGGARRVRPFARVDLDQDGVVRIAFANERRDGRIAGISAIPIRLAADLDGAKHRRQAGRGEQHVGADVGVAENPPAAGAHAGRGDEELDRRTGEPFKVDAFDENFAQRIVSERIEIVRREKPRHQVHGDVGGRGIQRPSPHHAIERRTLQWAQRRRARHLLPVGAECGARAGCSAFGPAVG